MTWTITKDKLPELQKRIEALANKRVLVGVPAETDPRKDNAPITNAALAFIHNYGSHARNIPPRPFLLPGLEPVMPSLAAGLRRAAQAAVNGDDGDVDRRLHMVGMAAQNAVRRYITTADFIPLKPATLAARRARGVSRTRPLIDTGQLRMSITYVIRLTSTGQDVAIGELPGAEKHGNA